MQLMVSDRRWLINFFLRFQLSFTKYARRFETRETYKSKQKWEAKDQFFTRPPENPEVTVVSSRPTEPNVFRVSEDNSLEETREESNISRQSSESLDASSSFVQEGLAASYRYVPPQFVPRSIPSIRKEQSSGSFFGTGKMEQRKRGWL